MESRETAIQYARILNEKKASDIEILDIRGLTIVADYFVIATGGSNLQVQALANALIDKAAEEGERPLRVEGLREGAWVLLDFGSVVVHVFKKDIREFYGLERLWGDAERVDASLTE